MELAEDSLIPRFAAESGRSGAPEYRLYSALGVVEVAPDADDRGAGRVVARHLKLLNGAHALGWVEYDNSDAVCGLPGPSKSFEGGLAGIARGRDEDNDLVPKAELGPGESQRGPIKVRARSLNASVGPW